MRIIQRTLPYVMATAITAGIAAKTLKAESSGFYKSEQKVEPVELVDEDSDKKGLPWLNIMGAAGILTFLGILKIADYMEKKENQEKNQTTEEDKEIPDKTK